MIIEIVNEVLTNLKSSLTTCSVVSSYPLTSPTFPLVSISEFENNMDTESVDTVGEHYNLQSIEINIFSNATNYRTEVNAIRKSIDDIMSGTYRMTRGFSGETPNYVDDNIYKYTIRYSYKIDKNKKIYRR